MFRLLALLFLGVALYAVALACASRGWDVATVIVFLLGGVALLLAGAIIR